MKKSIWRPILVAAGAATVVAALGGTMTDPTSDWYRGLAKPGWTPPDPVFGIAWTTIFTLATVSAVTAWRAAAPGRAADTVTALFLLNGFLNVLWSLLFFQLQRPDWALVEVAGLWLSIAALMIICWRHSRLASMLLLPYLLWVSVASALNYSIVQLNAPFG